MNAVAIIGLLVLVGLAIFQILLILGYPIGKYAWGGKYETLPKKLRLSSFISILLYAIFAVFLASKAGLISLIPESPLLTVGMWVFTAYFFAGIFLNAISRSKKERNLMTPVAAVLAISFLLVTIS